MSDEDINRRQSCLTTRPFNGIWPQIGARVYVDSGASVIGRVVLGDDASVWPGVVIRGDVNLISIGAATNVQDNATLHVTHDGPYTPGGYPLTVGAEVTVGHAAVLHACTIGNRVLVGMGAIILDGAILEDECFIGAGAVVSPRTTVSSRQLWLGNPARYVRDLSDKELEMLKYSAEHYVRLKDQFLNQAD